MAEAPVARKRAVSASRSKVAARKPSTRTRAALPVLDDEPETPNYALRLLDEPEPEREEEDTFALSLSKALEAINAHTANTPRTTPDVESSGSQQGASDSVAPSRAQGWLDALDKLPPIRLPIGPAIPWRFGLPALVTLVIVMAVMSRTAGASDSQGVQLPAQQTYAVEQEAPLFAQATPTAVPTETPASPPIGVQEPSGLGFDFVDIGIKLIAVLGLAYGSLLLLKKVGVGGTGSVSGAGAPGPSVRVTSSIALAPNRSIHVIRVPGGKTLLVGATPNAVNLLSDLGELAEDDTPEAASFLDALKGKLH